MEKTCQIFSIFATEFKTEIRSPDEILEKIRNSAVNPKPICEELTVIWDWKGWVKPNMSESKLQNHSFLHSFLVKKEGETGVLRGRKYPQDTGPWLPEDGIKLLKDGVDFAPIGTANNFADKTVDTFDVSPEWYEKILKSYRDHDSCYI